MIEPQAVTSARQAMHRAFNRFQDTMENATSVDEQDRARDAYHDAGDRLQTLCENHGVPMNP